MTKDFYLTNHNYLELKKKLEFKDKRLLIEVVADAIEFGMEYEIEYGKGKMKDEAIRVVRNDV